MLAWTFRARWDESSARRLLDEAVRVTRRHGLHHVEALALVSRAAVLQELGSSSASARDLEAATHALGRATASTPPSSGCSWRGSACRARSSSRTPVGSPRPRSGTARCWRTGIDGRLAAIATNNLALVLAERGAYDEALEQADAAVELSAQLPGLQAS